MSDKPKKIVDDLEHDVLVKGVQDILTEVSDGNLNPKIGSPGASVLERAASGIFDLFESVGNYEFTYDVNERYSRILSYLKLAAQLQHGYTLMGCHEDAKDHVPTIVLGMRVLFPKKVWVKLKIEEVVGEVMLRQYAATLAGEPNVEIPEIEWFARELDAERYTA